VLFLAKPASAAKLLPEAWFNMLFYRLFAGRWRRRLVRGKY
jgi:hypothetical protein